jgi:hypothetical protein
LNHPQAKVVAYLQHVDTAHHRVQHHPLKVNVMLAPLLQLVQKREFLSQL